MAADTAAQRAELIRRAQSAVRRTMLQLDADLAPLGTTIAGGWATSRHEVNITEAPFLRDTGTAGATLENQGISTCQCFDCGGLVRTAEAAREAHAAAKAFQAWGVVSDA